MSYSVSKVDGILLKDNLPFFPVGMYHVSWAGTNAQRLTALHALANAGFNAMYAAITDMDLAFLDEAHILGVDILVEFNADWPDVISALGDHPAILGWQIGDDIQERPPQETINHNTEVKAVDPNHVTFATYPIPGGSCEYVGLVDVDGHFYYPVPSESLGTVDYYLSKVASCGPNCLIGIPQAYAWPRRREPTAAELRNMTWQYLANGVKGLFWYAYFDGGWNIENHPDLWLELTALASEVMQLSDVFLSWGGERITSAGVGLCVTLWQQDERYILCVINLTAEDKLINFDLPDALDYQPAFVFERYPATLQNDGGTISGILAGHDVQIYRLENHTMSVVTDLQAVESDLRQKATELTTQADVIAQVVIDLQKLDDQLDMAAIALDAE